MRIAVRVALAVFVLVWIFGPYELRSAVPIWVPFLIALGLELNFVVAGLRPVRPTRPDRGPQAADRERFGYDEDAEELVLVREGERELWIPYTGDEEEPPEPLDLSPAPTERLRRPLRTFAAGLVLLAALALVFWVVERNTGWNGLSTDTRAEATARFSAEASRVAGKPVTIRCDEAGDFVGAVQHADGVAVVGGQLAYLTPERCLDLYRLAFEDRDSSNRSARAVVVLAHEAWHLRGIANEGVTECYAIQSAVDVGQRLGLSGATAERLMRRQLAENALQTNPAYRVPADCRDGGRLDLKPGVEQFP